MHRDVSIFASLPNILACPAFAKVKCRVLLKLSSIPDCLFISGAIAYESPLMYGMEHGLIGTMSIPYTLLCLICTVMRASSSGR
jgi:hypothetical protein